MTVVLLESLVRRDVGNIVHCRPMMGTFNVGSIAKDFGQLARYSAPSNRRGAIASKEEQRCEQSYAKVCLRICDDYSAGPVLRYALSWRFQNWQVDGGVQIRPAALWLRAGRDIV